MGQIAIMGGALVRQVCFSSFRTVCYLPGPTNIDSALRCMRPFWWFVLFYTPTSGYFFPFSDLHKFFGQKISEFLAVIFDQKTDLLCHRKTF